MYNDDVLDGAPERPLWFVDGKAYDLTDWISKHPGRGPISVLVPREAQTIQTLLGLDQWTWVCRDVFDGAIK